MLRFIIKIFRNKQFNVTFCFTNIKRNNQFNKFIFSFCIKFLEKFMHFVLDLQNSNNNFVPNIAKICDKITTSPTYPSIPILKYPLFRILRRFKTLSLSFGYHPTQTLPIFPSFPLKHPHTYKPTNKPEQLPGLPFIH